MSQMTNNLILSVLAAASNRPEQAPTQHDIERLGTEAIDAPVARSAGSVIARFSVGFLAAAVLGGVVLFTAQSLNTAAYLNSDEAYTVAQFGPAPGYAEAVAAGEAADAEEAAIAQREASIK